MNLLRAFIWGFALAAVFLFFPRPGHAETVFSPLWPDTIGDTEDPNFVGSPELLKMRSQIKACSKTVDPCVRLAYDTIQVTSVEPKLEECKETEEADFQSLWKTLSPCYKKIQDTANVALAAARLKCVNTCNACVHKLVGQQSEYPICNPTIPYLFQISGYDKSIKSFQSDLKNRVVTPGEASQPDTRERDGIKTPTHK